MKTSPSSASIDDEIQRHLSYNTTLTGTEGTLLFDYNSIKLKYKNTNLSETISTQIDDKRLEILRPQSSNTPQTTRSNIINQKAVENFDLYDIIQRYGNHPDLLELVLCSKVEEDRRKTAEAKLKQKELEYLIMKKEEQLCRTCNDNRKNTLPNESSTIDKGKSKQDNTTTLDGSHSSSNLILRLAPRNDTSIESQKEESKRKTEQEQDHGYSNKDMDYFSSTSSSYLSPVQLNLSSGPQRKRPSDTNTHTLESPTALEKRKTSSEEPVLQLQSLDYLNSRRISSNYQQLLPYKSFGEKAITKCSLPTNTLPPIGMSFKTYSSNDLTRNLTQVPSQPAISTSVPSNEYSNQTSWKYRALSTLDSFEASIMETLSFDHHSDASNIVSLGNTSELDAQTSSMALDDDTTLHIPSLQKKRKSSKHNHINSSNKPFSCTESSTKKLLLPPSNRPDPQVASSLSNRPRRRRREMQAITMIIETKEFPYNDDYVWKNNGNTTHKSTGQKSIYYKCSNSIVGCPVNKTVTFRDNGEYLIKYRGNHLEECNKIKRIVDI